VWRFRDKCVLLRPNEPRWRRDEIVCVRLSSTSPKKARFARIITKKTHTDVGYRSRSVQQLQSEVHSGVTSTSLAGRFSVPIFFSRNGVLFVMRD